MYEIDSKVEFKCNNDKETRTIKVLGEHFDNTAELVKYCDSRPHLRADNIKIKNLTCETDWYGCDSYKQAVDYAINGWDKALENEKFKKFYKDTNCMQVEKLRGFKADIEGFMPLVPNYLMGLPQTMLNYKHKPIKTKVIDLYYEMTVTAQYTSDDIMDVGMKIISAVVALEKQGYKLRLTNIQAACHTQSYPSSGCNYICQLLLTDIKSENRLLDLYGSMFGFMNPAMFRCVGFVWQSTSPNILDIGMGRGRTFNYQICENNYWGKSKPYKLVDMIKDVIKDKNAVVLDASELICSNKTVEDIMKLILGGGD